MEVGSVAFNNENWKHKNITSFTFPIFLTKIKKIPQSTFPPPPYILWLQALALWSVPISHLHWAGASPHLQALQTPGLLMNKHRSLYGAPYTLETMFSFQVFRIAQSGMLTTSVGPHCGAEGRDNGASLTSSSPRSSVSSCTNSTGNGFFLRVTFRLLKLCKPGKHNNCFVKPLKCLTIHFPKKEAAVLLMLRIVNPKCGELIK